MVSAQKMHLANPKHMFVVQSAYSAIRTPVVGDVLNFDAKHIGRVP